jgi:hypothetical protein
MIVLVLLASAAVLINPSAVLSQGEDGASTPTPQPQAKPKKSGQVLESGDTQGMIIAASCIVLIILLGVIISSGSSRPPKPSDHGPSSPPQPSH